MKIGFCQFAPTLRKKETNLNKALHLIHKHDFDIMLLPELFSTGYFLDSREDALKLAENIPNGETSQKMLRAAQELNGVVVGTFPEFHKGEVYNTAAVFSPEGFLGKQRKIFLTDYEKKIFSKGSNLNIFQFNNLKFGIAICFDLWFPELIRKLKINGISLLLHPANFGSSISLDTIRTRAVENLIHTVTCNRIGTEKAQFIGESRIVNHNGNILYTAKNNEEVYIHELSQNELNPKNNIVCENFEDEIKRAIQLFNK